MVGMQAEEPCPTVGGPSRHAHNHYDFAIDHDTVGPRDEEGAGDEIAL